jgi:hypothetical protein
LEVIVARDHPEMLHVSVLAEDIAPRAEVSEARLPHLNIFLNLVTLCLLKMTFSHLINGFTHNLSSLLWLILNHVNIDAMYLACTNDKHLRQIVMIDVWHGEQWIFLDVDLAEADWWRMLTLNTLKMFTCFTESVNAAFTCIVVKHDSSIFILRHHLTWIVLICNLDEFSVGESAQKRRQSYTT